MAQVAIRIPIRLEIKSIDQAQLERMASAFRSEMEEACDDIGLHVRDTVVQLIEDLPGEELMDTGLLWSSITYAKEVEASQAVVTVGTDVFYAKFQEFGTVEHWVPFTSSGAESLYLWCKRKLGWIEPTRAEAEHLDQSKKWLKPRAGARPQSGFKVSGEAKPFLYPGWVQSLSWILKRLDAVGSGAVAKVVQGE